MCRMEELWGIKPRQKTGMRNDYYDDSEMSQRQRDIPRPQDCIDWRYKQHDEEGVAYGQDGGSECVDDTPEGLQPACIVCGGGVWRGGGPVHERWRWRTNCSLALTQSHLDRLE